MPDVTIESFTDARDAKAVLVPLDGSAFSAQAADVGDSLAERLDIPLRYLAVADSKGTSVLLRARIGAQLRSRRLPHAIPVIATDADPAAAIAGAARELPAIVCMATHGRGRVAGAVIGSVAEAVVRQLGQPVLLTGPAFDRDRHAKPERIVVCVDGSKESETIVPAAARWAHDLSLRMDIVTVLHPKLSRQLAGTFQSSDLVEDMQLHRLADQVHTSAGIEAQWEALHGTDPVEPILHYAKAMPGTIIALSTHGRSGLQRAVVGSVAARLAHNSPTPLLVLRPELPSPRP